MHGGIPNKEFNENNNQCILDLDKELSYILNELAINRNVLNSYAQHIMFLLEARANRDTKNRHGKTLSHYLDEKLSNILNELAMKKDELDNPDRIQYIMFLLGAGADRGTQNRHGKTLSHYLDERLSDILGWLAIDRGILNDYIQRIMFLLQAGANPNVQNQDGKTLLHYVAEHNDTGGIRFLLGACANPNVQDQSEKTPLHYAAENNCLQAIELLLKAKTDQNVQDQSGKTPFEYVTEHECRQALKDLDCSSNDKTTCTKLSDSDSDNDSDYYSDDSHENEENPAKSPNNDNRTPTDQQTSSERPVVSDRDSEDSSDYYSEDEDSSCSSSDYLFLEDSLLAKLEIPLTTDEQKLIGKFCEEIIGTTAQNKQESEESILESIEKIVNEYLEKGLRLNSSCSNDNDNGDKETVTSLIFKEMEGVIAQLRVNPRSSTAMLNTHDYTDEGDGDEYKASDIIIKRITSNLLLKGGMGKKFLFGDTELTNKHYDFDYLDDLKRQYKDRKEELISIACEGIVNKSKQTHEYDLKAEIDNQYFYVKYSQDSIIEPVKILNNEKAKELNLKVGILQIGKSIVRVESVGKKRNYTDILKGSIKMSFTTDAGEISIYLHPSEKDGNKIEVEIDKESEARLNKLKAEKRSLGENCLLGGKSVLDAIEDKVFEKNGSVPTEITKDVPSTDLTQVCLQRKARSRG